MISENVYSYRILQLCEVRKYTIRRLGEELGILRQTLSYWINGHTQPRIRHIVMLCEFFDVPVEAFFDPKWDIKEYAKHYDEFGDRIEDE